jgi:hypothetical protein
MPVLRSASRPVSLETYQAVIDRIDVEHKHPLGLIMHGAGEVDGHVRIEQVWDTVEYARRWEEEELVPALQELGVTTEGTVTFIELRHLVTP